MITHQKRPLIFSLDDVLQPDECDGWVRLAEEHGFQRAAINNAVGAQVDVRVRSNARVILDDRDKAALLFSRLGPSCPPLRGWAPTGCNERLRVYRYEPGQRFRRHRDGHHERQDGERSFLTALVYLNDGYEGGETWFRNVTVTPKRGSALLFEHHLEHAGVVVTAGRKYVLRTDVMYFPDFTGRA